MNVVPPRLWAGCIYGRAVRGQDHEEAIGADSFTRRI